MAVYKIIPVLFLSLVSFSTLGQVNRYMVLFKDKHGSPYSVTRPGEFLSQKAIQRRIHQGLGINEKDLPVAPAYVSGVRQAGAQVFFKSRWFNGVLVQCSADLVESIKNLPYVDTVQFVAPGVKLTPNGGRKRFNLKHKKTNDDVTQGQLSMVGINYMHEAGIFGDSITIAVFDAGYQGVDTIPAFRHLYEAGRIVGEYDFVYNTDNVYRYDDHGTEVFSVMAAQIPDAFTAAIPNAKYHLFVTEDASSEYRVEEYNWAFAAEFADSAGVDIISSSLGYYDFDNTSMNYTKAQMDGETAVSTRAAQWAADRGMVVVVSAGNEGNVASWRIITAPADAVDVIAVANVDQQGNRSSSSSIGPSADNRIKPDLAALGTGVKTIKSNGAQGSASGTSLSAPLITSLVAGVWQKYPYLSNLEVIALLKGSASLAKNPNNLIGYGIPNFKAAVNYHERQEREDLFRVLPTWVEDSITVSPIDPETVNNCFVELINSHGQVLAEEKITFTWLKREYSTDMSSLPAGIYFVRVWFEDQRHVFRIVKQ